MHHVSRKASLTVGGVVTAAVLAAGVASAAASVKTAHRIARAEKRQTLRAHRFDKTADRLDARSLILVTTVNALAAGTKKTDALAKLADLETKTTAAKADDAKVLTALTGINPGNVTAAEATLRAGRKDIKAARRDAAKVLRDLR